MWISNYWHMVNKPICRKGKNEWKKRVWFDEKWWQTEVKNCNKDQRRVEEITNPGKSTQSYSIIPLGGIDTVEQVGRIRRDWRSDDWSLWLTYCQVTANETQQLRTIAKFTGNNASTLALEIFSIDTRITVSTQITSVLRAGMLLGQAASVLAYNLFSPV